MHSSKAAFLSKSPTSGVILLKLFYILKISERSLSVRNSVLPGSDIATPSFQQIRGWRPQGRLEDGIWPPRNRGWDGGLGGLGGHGVERGGRICRALLNERRDWSTCGSGRWTDELAIEPVTLELVALLWTPFVDRPGAISLTVLGNRRQCKKCPG